MSRKIITLLTVFLIVTSCGKEVVPKPQKLISRDKMVSILVDIHLADAAYQTRHYTSEEMKKYTESDFYYSVLKKHDIADAVFEESLIYYSGKPKEFEKIYSRVISKLNEMEQLEVKKTQQPVNLKKTGKE